MLQHTIKLLSFCFLLLLATGSFVFITGCKNKPEETAVVPSKPPADSAVNYPINAYIRRQITDVDTTPYFLYQLTTINGKKDSTVIKRSSFDSAAKRFLYPDLEQESLQKNYTESVFQDATTDSYTFTYTAKNKNLTVQSANVLLDTGTQNVKWIFINAMWSAGDSTVIERASWKGDRSCSISRGITHAGGKEMRDDLIFVWNDKKEQ